MQTKHPDFLVIGLGAMGSAITYQLAKQGANVVGLDQFTPPHAHGSTHGETRITRQAIGEGLQFVPLAMRSHQLWREIENQTGQSLLNACGGIVIAREGQTSRMHAQHDFLGNTFRAAQTFGIDHQRWHAHEIHARFPQFVLSGDEVAYFEPGAGYVAPEACVSAQLELAARHGATLKFAEGVQRVAHVSGTTVVETHCARYTAGTTIVAAGAWVPQLLPTLAAALTVRRQVLIWFAIDDATSYAADNFPIFIWHWGAGANDVFYGFPDVGSGGNIRAIKVATEQSTFVTTPETIERVVSANEIADMVQRHIAGKLRGISGRCVKSATCLYTNTAQANFI
ncbi:MAG: N-methyl-L-tryptophan oxidase, partial [Pseudomonadota bacterium]